MTVDVFCYRGPIDPRGLGAILEAVPEDPAEAAVLLLTTQGGTANDAYKIACFFHNKYTRFDVAVVTWCKSAGTLIALGAHNLVMSPLAELGPLDVQLLKEEGRAGERTSGLVPGVGLEVLSARAWTAFEFLYGEMREKAGLTSARATEAAVNLVCGIIGPVADQIDPLRLGENEMHLRVAERYGAVLASLGKNTQDGGVNTLVRRYPSHDYVINRTEARRVFNQVFDMETTPLWQLVLEHSETRRDAFHLHDAAPEVYLLEWPKAEAPDVESDVQGEEEGSSNQQSDEADGDRTCNARRDEADGTRAGPVPESADDASANAEGDEE